MKTVGERRRPDLEAWGDLSGGVAMGKLVQFESRKQGRTEDRREPSSTAEILIFTGVRYERDVPETPTRPTSSRAKRKRV
jgi:hypothetical protein